MDWSIYFDRLVRTQVRVHSDWLALKCAFTLIGTHYGAAGTTHAPRECAIRLVGPSLAHRAGEA